MENPARPCTAVVRQLLEMYQARRTLLSFGHATGSAVVELSDGAIELGGLRHAFFSLRALAGFAFFIAFFLRDAPPRF